MFENWFDQINGFLHTHPHWLAQLAFLFRLKLWLLTLLMGYFLYLIHKDQAKPVPTKKERTRTHFVA
jgi:hypothetical protein